MSEDIKNTLNEEEKTVESAAAPREESMEDYKEELEKSYRKLHPGDSVTGKIVSVDENEVIVDLDYFAPGKIPAGEISADENFNMKEELHVGDEISATVLRTDDGAGSLILSAKKDWERRIWNELQEKMEKGEVLHGTISSVVKAGVVMMVKGVRGFIPISKLDLGFVENAEPYVGREVDAKIITVDPVKKNLVLSVKDVLQEEETAAKEEALKGLEEGAVVKGIVEDMKDYGAFVNIGNGLTGLLHVSQIANHRVNHPKDVLTKGEEIEVKVTKIEGDRISLSKKATEAPTFQRERRSGGRDRRSSGKPRTQDYKDNGTASTNLGSLLKDLKLD